MAEHIETLLKTSAVHHPTAQTMERAYIKDYDAAYRASIADPEQFWDGVAKELEWFSPWHTVLEWKYPWAKWFLGGTCNITYNCLDRHVRTWRTNKVAVIWVGERGEERIFTYGELYKPGQQAVPMPSKALGCKHGDRVTIYLPKIPEQIVAMLACARIGLSFIPSSIPVLVQRRLAIPYSRLPKRGSS